MRESSSSLTESCGSTSIRDEATGGHECIGCRFNLSEVAYEVVMGMQCCLSPRDSYTEEKEYVDALWRAVRVSLDCRDVDGRVASEPADGRGRIGGSLGQHRRGSAIQKDVKKYKEYKKHRGKRDEEELTDRDRSKVKHKDSKDHKETHKANTTEGRDAFYKPKKSEQIDDSRLTDLCIRIGQEKKGLEGTSNKVAEKHNCTSTGRVRSLINEWER